MKICVFGAGAVGTYLAARLLDARCAEVSVVARGEHLSAVRRRGIVLRTADNEITQHPIAATDDPAELPAQDLVAVTVKSPSLPAVAGPVARLLGEGATALFIGNGIPWWWNHGLNNDGALPLIDPAGALWNEIGPHRALGSVIVSSNEIFEPGVVTHKGGNRWTIGEPGGRSSARLRTTIDLLRRAGLEAVEAQDLRRDIWRKLFLNVAYYSICGLARLPTSAIVADFELTALAEKLIRETAAIAAAQGCDFGAELDVRALLKPGGKPAMLQDIERNRPTEVEAIFGQIQAFGRQARLSTPALDTVTALLRGLDGSIRATRNSMQAR